MGEQRIKVPRACDATIAEVFAEIAKTFNVPRVSVTALGGASLEPISLLEEPKGDWKLLLDQKSYLIDYMSLTVRQLNIAFWRGGNYATDKKSPIFDEVVLSWGEPNNQLSIHEKLQIVTLLNHKLRPFEPDKFPGGPVTDEQSQLVAMHNSTLERLERLNEKLIQDSEEFRKKLEDQFEIKLGKKEAEYLERKVILEKETEGRQKSLLERQAAIDEKLKEIDDRDNTHARRAIREKMLDDVKKRIGEFGVSKKTEHKRRPVFFGILLLMLTLGLYTRSTYIEITAADERYFGLPETIQKNIGL